MSWDDEDLSAAVDPDDGQPLTGEPPEEPLYNVDCYGDSWLSSCATYCRGITSEQNGAVQVCRVEQLERRRAADGPIERERAQARAPQDGESPATIDTKLCSPSGTLQESKFGEMSDTAFDVVLTDTETVEYQLVDGKKVTCSTTDECNENARCSYGDRDAGGKHCVCNTGFGGKDCKQLSRKYMVPNQAIPATCFGLKLLDNTQLLQRPITDGRDMGGQRTPDVGDMHSVDTVLYATTAGGGVDELEDGFRQVQPQFVQLGGCSIATENDTIVRISSCRNVLPSDSRLPKDRTRILEAWNKETGVIVNRNLAATLTDTCDQDHCANISCDTHHTIYDCMNDDILNATDKRVKNNTIPHYHELSWKVCNFEEGSGGEIDNIAKGEIVCLANTNPEDAVHHQAEARGIGTAEWVKCAVRESDHFNETSFWTPA